MYNCRDRTHGDEFRFGSVNQTISVCSFWFVLMKNRVRVWCIQFAFSSIPISSAQICAWVHLLQRQSVSQLVTQFKTPMNRVRTIPKKLPNTQYYWVIPIPIIPNTNTDTCRIISHPPCAAALSELDTRIKVHYCAHCVNLMSVM